MSTSNSGYGDYLEEQKKQQQPEVPNATPPAATPAPAAPTTRAMDGYGQFLETLANNKRIENTPTNAKTYADYLTYLGQDPVGDYNAKVRQAHLEYQKGLATYGQNAEKMAKSGLVGSGYGEYLTGLAYQGKQAAVGAAQRDAKTAIDKGFASYGDYIEGLKSTNEQNAINGIISGALEGDAAKEYARSQGVTDDRIEFVLSQTASTVSQAKAQKLADATSALSALVSEGQTLESAITSLSGVYDDEVLGKVKENMQKATQAQISAAIGSATGVSGYKASLDQQLASGAITEEQYNAQVVAGQNANNEFVKKAINGDFSGLTAYAEANGLDISGGTSDQVDAVVDHMATNGHITKEQQQQYYIDSWTNSIEETEFSAKDMVNEGENLYKLYSGGKITEAQYLDLLGKLGVRAKDLFGGAEISKASGHSTSFSIKYNSETYEKESIDIHFGNSNYMKTVTGAGFVAGKSVEVANNYGGGTFTVVFGTINGRVAYKVGDKYYQAKSGTPEYANTKQNAAFIAYMMVP